MGNLPLFDTLFDTLPEIKEDESREGTIAERAARFHEMNPHVYEMAVKTARYIKSRGVRRYSIKAIWEIMRFRYLETSGDIYKLNNNYHAWYARKIMQDNADLADFFKTRNCPNDPEYWTREANGTKQGAEAREDRQG